MILALCLALLLPAAAAPKQASLVDVVDGIDRTFSRTNDMSADFVQIYHDALNQRQQESGHLYLKRERMMRFEYKQPEEKFYISDSKNLWMYIPADKQVMKESIRESIDDRLPFMFLLRREKLSNEFEQFERLSRQPFVPGTVVIRMTPKRETDLKELVMEVDPATFLIRRVDMSYIDGQRQEFIFSNIRTNVGLKTSLFDFAVPVGVEVIEGPGQ